MCSIESRLKKVLSNVLNVDEDSIVSDSSPDSIASWDSINHMNLVVALEQEFAVQFDEQDIVILLSYEIIYETCANTHTHTHTHV